MPKATRLLRFPYQKASDRPDSYRWARILPHNCSGPSSRTIRYNSEVHELQFSLDIFWHLTKEIVLIESRKELLGCVQISRYKIVLEKIS